MNTTTPNLERKGPHLVSTGGGGSVSEPASEELPEREGSQLPQPKGWRILIALPEIEEKTVGGVIKADTTKLIEQTSTVVGLVLAMGPECYTDKERFGDEPWCKEGDFVLIGAYKGVRFNIYGKEFRIINDDTVQAVVEDPRGYTRA
jgi:co-chaperonin GroES (HSP10)|tara:strand:+ start:4527 stop:4967 length:441 start_codon:yes stop_codon:yes gene_type:complete